MFSVLLLLWVIFNGKITVEILAVGAVVSAALTFAWYRVFEIKRNMIIPRPSTVWFYLKYAFNLIIEIVRCNIRVMQLILHPAQEIHPQLLTFRMKLKKDGHKAVLANSITLTPGTITVGMKDDLIRVHALDASFMDGIEECDMVTQLEKLEEETKHA